MLPKSMLKRVSVALNVLVILALVIPAGPVAASAPVPLAPAQVGQVGQRSLTHVDLTTAITTVETPTPVATTETPAPVVEVTATPTPASQPVTGLVLTVAAQPESAQPGETVTFTVTLQNTSDTASSNVTLADALPTEYELNPNSIGELNYDSETRTLSWTTAEIAAGQTVTLTYTVTIGTLDLTTGPTYIVDSLAVSATELAEALKVETAVLVTPADVEMSSVGSEGGSASGLAGAVQLDVPAGAVDSPQAIVVQDLIDEIPATNGDVWTVFEVSLLSSSSVGESSSSQIVEGSSSQAVGENAGEEAGSGGAEGQGAGGATETPTPEATATEVGPTETATPDATATEGEATPVATLAETATEVATLDPTPTPEATVTAEATEPPATPEIVEAPTTEEVAAEVEALVETETDTQLALQPVEAAFDQPVEMTISFDGLTDLATLDAGYEPYLVTLDEASGIWIVMPIESVNAEANTITAEVSHFSTWGAGVGPSFPQNGAGVLLFDSAAPDLFGGNSHFSIPIWTPPGRNGMQPSLALSYSSGTANGVLGDIQSGWTGFGWSIGSIEVARKITTKLCAACGTGGAFGYKDEYILLFGGTGLSTTTRNTHWRQLEMPMDDTRRFQVPSAKSAA